MWYHDTTMEQRTEKQQQPAGRGLAARRYAWADKSWSERRLSSWSKRVRKDELSKIEKLYGLLPVGELPF